MKITKVEARNIQAFSEILYTPEKNINLIYGENGAGKSSFVEIFDLLIMIFKRQVISSQVLSSKHDGDVGMDAIFDLYNNYSTIGNDENMYILFDFIYEEKNGTYQIELDKNNNIAFERLEYAIDSRKSTIYLRTEEGIITKYPALRNLAIKYELEEKNSFISFIDLLKYRNLIDNDGKVFELIERITDSLMCNHKFHKNEFHVERGGVLNEVFLVNEDKHESFKEKIENEVLKEFKEFVYQIDDNVLDIIYKTDYLEVEKKYQKSMCFKKQLGEQIITIPFEKESTGTKKYLEYFNYIHMAKHVDNIYVWDEFGANLHQNLAVKIFEYVTKVMKEYNRQMFLTSHNVFFLDSKELNNKEKQLIINNEGIRKIKNLVGIDSKDKISKKYLEGYYGASPSLSSIWEYSE